MNRCYRELSQYTSFEDRFAYLSLSGVVGETTFGYDRDINQQFYRSYEWKQVRDFVIVRDNACDLGVPGHDILGELLIHHMNPMGVNDIIHGEEWILDPEFLITTTHRTHNAIHYGNAAMLPRAYVERSPGDTKLW